MSSVDDERQDDDRPAVVADVAVDPVQRPEQRHDDDREHAEVDRAHQIAIDGGEHVEVFRADEEPERPIGGAGSIAYATNCARGASSTLPAAES